MLPKRLAYRELVCNSAKCRLGTKSQRAIAGLLVPGEVRGNAAQIALRANNALKLKCAHKRGPGPSTKLHRPAAFHFPDLNDTLASSCSRSGHLPVLRRASSDNLGLSLREHISITGHPYIECREQKDAHC
jgi:hypothetical protein